MTSRFKPDRSEQNTDISTSWLFTHHNSRDLIKTTTTAKKSENKVMRHSLSILGTYDGNHGSRQSAWQRIKTAVCSTNLWDSFPAAGAVSSLVPLPDICIPKAERHSACFIRQRLQIVVYVVATIKHRRERIFTKCCKVNLIHQFDQKLRLWYHKLFKRKAIFRSSVSELIVHRTSSAHLKKRDVQALFNALPSLIAQELQGLLRQTTFQKPHETLAHPFHPHFNLLWIQHCIKLLVSNVSIK